MPPQFEIGNVVGLKSGGHAMTIIDLVGDIATCAWSIRGDIKRSEFPSAAIELMAADSLAALIEASMRQPHDPRDSTPVDKLNASNDE